MRQARALRPGRAATDLERIDVRRPTPGLRQNTQNRATDYFSISKPFDPTGVFPALPFHNLINILVFIPTLLYLPPLPCQCTIPPLRVFLFPSPSQTNPIQAVQQHASCRQQRNAYLGAQHLLGRVLPVWRLGPERKGC